MLHDFRNAGALTLPPSATVVVGAGAAGLALALRLADAGEEVVLVESGGDSKSPHAARESAHLNDAVQSGLLLDGVVNGRSRVLGGTTALWHGQCMRLHEIDMQARDWVARSGWPFGLSTLESHYADAERFLNVSGAGYGASRWEDHKNLPPLSWDADRLLHDFTEYAPRPHLGHLYRDRLVSHPRLHVVLHATASAVQLDREQAVGLELRHTTRTPAILSARRVVLAGGAIENARLLMLSDPAGIGLGTGREHTGRYYQDHPIIRTARVLPQDHRVLQDRYIAVHRKGRRLFPKLRLAPRAQEQHGLLDAAAVFVHDHEDPARDALRRLILAARYGRRPERAVQDAMRSLSAPARLLRDLWRRYAKGMATGTRPSAVWLQLWIEQLPDAASRVSLAEQTDRLGLRQSLIHWRCSDLELHTSRQFTHWVDHDLRRLRLGHLQLLPPMADDSAWRDSLRDAAHPAGTTRMSTDPRHGVVDAHLKVHGVRGLYVVGSSAFPICGYANPTLTIIALAYRLAAHLTSGAECPD